MIFGFGTEAVGSTEPKSEVQQIATTRRMGLLLLLLVSLACVAADWKLDVLQRHNQFRATRGLPALRWDPNLEKQAQRESRALVCCWALVLFFFSFCFLLSPSASCSILADRLLAVYTDSCPNGHDVDRLRATGTGENIAWGSDPTGSVDMWYAEKKDYNLASNTCRSGAMCGHYTQVMWKGTTSVGCGWKPSCVFQGNAAFAPGELVCRYWPAGNVNGARPFGRKGGIVFKNLGSYRGMRGGGSASAAARRCRTLRRKLRRCRTRRCRRAVRRSMRRVRRCR